MAIQIMQMSPKLLAISGPVRGRLVWPGPTDRANHQVLKPPPFPALSVEKQVIQVLLKRQFYSTCLMFLVLSCLSLSTGTFVPNRALRNAKTSLYVSAEKPANLAYSCFLFIQCLMEDQRELFRVLLSISEHMHHPELGHRSTYKSDSWRY